MFVLLSGGALTIAIGCAHAHASRVVLAGFLAVAVAYYHDHVPKLTDDPIWFARVHWAEDLLPRLTIGAFLLVTATRVGDKKRMFAAALAWMYWDYWLKLLWSHQFERPPVEPWLLNLERALAALVVVPPNLLLSRTGFPELPSAPGELGSGRGTASDSPRRFASVFAAGMAVCVATSGIATATTSYLLRTVTTPSAAKTVSKRDDPKLLKDEIDAMDREIRRLTKMGRNRDANRLVGERNQLAERFHHSQALEDMSGSEFHF